jgi:hypothetical protein
MESLRYLLKDLKYLNLKAVLPLIAKFFSKYFIFRPPWDFSLEAFSSLNP